MADDTTSSAIARQIFLRSFSGGRLGKDAARYLSQGMRDDYLRAGTRLYRRGEAADRIFFVVRGKVRLSVEGAKPWTLGAGAIIGLLDVLQDRPHSRTASAVTDVHALVLQADDYFDALEDNFEFTRNTIVTIAGELHKLRLSIPPSGGFAASTSASAPPQPRAEDGERRTPPPSRLNLVERTIVLRDVRALRSSSVQALTSMAALIEERRLEPGSMLYSQGDAASSIYFVVDGSISIEREDPPIRAWFGPSSLVGGYASLGSSEQPYSARVDEAAVVLAVQKEDLFDLLELHFELVRSMLADMAMERAHVLHQRAEQAAQTRSGESEASLSREGTEILAV